MTADKPNTPTTIKAEPKNRLTSIVWALLAGLFILCVARVLYLDRQITSPGEEVVRIAHWQLEAGYRDSLQKAIEKYESLNPGVKVVQLGITEKVYSQWLNTHLLASTAPDIFELGRSKVLNNENYLPRFLLPLSEPAQKPNPYNKGTAQESIRWRDTFFDGMRSGLHPATQEYYSAPTCLFTARIYINADLLKKATGSNQPPKTLGDLLNAAEKIRTLQTADGAAIVPIAGGADCAQIFMNGYLIPFTANYESILDTDLDGAISQREMFAGWATDKISFNSPGIKDYYLALGSITRCFAPGFMSMGRDQALFLFVQGRAGMIAAGAWEAAGLTRNVPFEVIIIDFPLPGPNEPYANVIAGRANEASLSGGVLYGINRSSRHASRALDFLQFLTSAQGNQLLNEGPNWVPIIAGAKPTDNAKPFVPQGNGYTSKVIMHYGAVPASIWWGQLWRYLQAEVPIQHFFDSVNQALADPRYGGKNAWALEHVNQQQWVRQQERAISAFTLLDMLQPKSTDNLKRLGNATIEQQRVNNGQDVSARYLDTFNEPIGQP